MGRACSTYGGRGEKYTGFGGENLKERGHLEETGVDGRIILKLILRKWDGDVDRIDPTQDRGRWRALVNAVLNLRIPQNVWNFFTS